MSEAEIAGRLAIELGRAADQVAADATQLVSITIEYIERMDIAEVRTHIGRKTRTLVFMSADAFDAKGARVASATSVHKVESA